MLEHSTIKKRNISQTPLLTEKAACLSKTQLLSEPDRMNSSQSSRMFLLFLSRWSCKAAEGHLFSLESRSVPCGFVGKGRVLVAPSLENDERTAPMIAMELVGGVGLVGGRKNRPRNGMFCVWDGSREHKQHGVREHPREVGLLPYLYRVEGRRYITTSTVSMLSCVSKGL